MIKESITLPSSSSSLHYTYLTYSAVLLRRRSLFALLSVTINVTIFCFYDTILADYVDKHFRLNSSVISLIYAAPTVGYLIIAPVTYCMV